MKKIITAHLREDQRIKNPEVARHTVFKTPHYKIEMSLYRGVEKPIQQTLDLVTCSVTYLQEDLEITFKHITENVKGDPKEFFQKLLVRLEDSEKTPYHLIRDAKNWAGIELTHSDLAALLAAGVDSSKKNG